jgi:hypothetical protein
MLDLASGFFKGAPLASLWTMTETATRTHCPTCGARLARPDLSICAYCTAPLGLEQEKPETTETMQRLARMAEHDKYPPAMAWDPPPELEDDIARARAARGTGLLVLAVPLIVLALLWALASSGGLRAAWPAWTAAGLMILAGAGLHASARARIASWRKTPLLKRPALVTSRRSETHVGGRHYLTTYYFQLEFADGSEGEFGYPGRGGNHELLVTGNTGVAYTRGPRLVAFRQIRV